ncbi:hypothetical protein AAHE18_12G037200 [Arachis hypogaea]
MSGCSMVESSAPLLSSNSVFMEFCLALNKELVYTIQDEISALMNFSEVFLIFQIIHEFLVMWRSLFSDDVSMKDDMMELERKLGEAIRDYYFREDEVPSEIRISYSCEVHPITASINEPPPYCF